MPINLTPKLTHTCQVQRTGEAVASVGFTDRLTVTTVSTSKCFCYYGDVNLEYQGVNRIGRPLEGFDKTVILGWTIIFPKTFTFLQAEDLIVNVVDQNGSQVLAQGRVHQIITYTHYRHGTQFRQAQLKLN